MEVAVRPQPHELVRQLQFPPGYHFVPTEAELVDVYLRGKIDGRELPLDIVNEVAVLDWQPGSLVEAYKGYGENKWYFFTVREPSSSNKEEEPNRKVRVPGVKATWKATGSLVPISVEGGERQQEEPGAVRRKEKVVVGTKRVLIYQSSDAEEDGKWSMHEYILKGHAKIGQYALCSIQRKQHSETVDANAGEGCSSSSRKRTRARNVDPEKTKKKRTINKAASTKRIARRKNKTSARAEEEQQQEEVALVSSPVKPPFTPPQHQLQAPPQALQQEQKALAAYGAPVLTALPLQGYPAHSDGMLGDYAPMHEEDTRAGSFQRDDDMSRCLEMQNLLRSCNREEQLPCYTVNEVIADSHAQYQLYQQQDDCEFFALEDQYASQYLYQDSDLFPGDTTQNSSIWKHGQHQIYQQEVGGAFGTPDQQTNAQYYDQLPYELMCSGYLPAQAGGYCSSDQFIGSVQGDTAASGSDGDMCLAADDEFDAISMLRDDDPEECVGAQDGSNPEALQSQDPGSWGQQQHTAHGHVCDGPPSRSISDFWA
ncbi:hypothetical protein GQ55_3G156200 [Panicum hallii var. hallii]|uniref:NAC domain-containing protein n=1 Tax=Panicum hallii var. hallii TaxID=1504633 RepID=A0A2T7E9V8_9POAL|nr:hypothetical protein GQ55_3G156200 [Panicum hallii var. hallii]